MTIIINNSLKCICERFAASTSRARIFIAGPQNLTFVKTHQKHTLCVKFIVHIISVIISISRSVLVPSMYVCIFICCTIWYKMIREHINKANNITKTNIIELIERKYKQKKGWAIS